MLSHHAQVFERLNSLYNDADVYIATSDKVEPGRSPFNFEEKKQIIASHGIDPDRVLYARSPYNWEELAQYFSDVENTVIFFAVGEKDMESNPRFKFDNIDDKGVNQKIKGGATYYQMINTYKDEPLPMNQRGYILKVPTISTEEEVASASAFRKAISTAPDKESAKLIFNKQFKEFNNNVFELVYNKLKGEKMSEDLNIMKKLAGLEEKYQYANTEEKLQDMINSHQYTIDVTAKSDPDAVYVEDHEDAIGWYEALLDIHRKTGEDKFEAPGGGDTAWREMIQQEMEDVGLYKPHGQGDLRGVDNLPEDAEMAEMRKLAGLEVSEGAPIEFEDQVSVKDVNFAEPSKSSSKLSIANRFPEGSDVNDIEVKKEMYVKELLKSPVALLSEINERIMPDENGLEVSSKLNKILDGMRDGGIADLEAEDKGFVMDLVKHSLKNMELEAGDDREFDPETSSLESVNLDDIRQDYQLDELVGRTLRYMGRNVQQGRNQADALQKYAKDKGVDIDTRQHRRAKKRIDKKAMAMKQEDYNLDEIVDASDPVSYLPPEKNFFQKTGDLAKKGIEKTGAGLGNIGNRMANRAADLSTGGLGGQLPREMVKKGLIPKALLKRPGAAKLAQMIANNPKLAGAGAIGLGSLAAYGVGKGISKLRNRKKNNEMEEGKVKDMAMDQADDFYGKVSDIADKTNDIEKAILDAWKDEEENPPVWALDDGAIDILTNAGLIEPEPEEPEMEESFDPRMEPSREEEAMNHIADGNFGQAAAVLGDTSPNAGDNLMGEWSEYCSLRGLDQKDSLDDFDHVESFIGEIIGMMDDKYYPAEMESIEEQEDAIVGKALDNALTDLKKLAGLY